MSSTVQHDTTSPTRVTTLLMQDRVYGVLHKHTSTGPFDGGCVIYAKALKAVFGGVMVSLIRSNGTADHAAVLIDDILYDFAGGLPINKFVERFNENELAKVTSFRNYTPSDLPDAPRNATAVDELVVILNQWRGSLTLPQ